MPKYRWRGINKKEKPIEGEMLARSAREVKVTLRRQSIIPTKVLEPSIMDLDLQEWMVENGFAKPFSKEELTRLTKQLSTLIDAGVAIIESLEMLFRQEKNQALKMMLRDIITSVSEGSTFSEALSQHNGFDKLYVNLVKAGEAGGILDTILAKLAAHMEKQEKTKKEVKGALTYPVMVFVVGIGVISILMVFVVPQFTQMLLDTGQELPMITKIVIAISEFMGAYAHYLLLGVGVAAFMFLRFIKSSGGKKIWDRFTMKLPVFGDLIVKANLANFTRTLSTMLSSGISIVESLEICTDTIDNDVIVKDLKRIQQSVVRGKSMTEPLSRISYFPPMVNQMMKVGEATGNTDQMLLRCSEVLEEEVDELVGQATKMLEPLILVFLGGMIAAVLVAMYLPMFMSAGGSQ